MNNGYTPPILTVDGIVMQIIDNQLCVLLIKRDKQPFKNSWALPGGYNPEGETTLQALNRILKKKAGLDSNKFELIEQLYTFDTIARDPRGHAVAVSYMALTKDQVPVSSGTTETPTFFPIDHLPDVAYDHKDIIKYAQTRLRGKVTYTNAVFALLPELFTLTQLQNIYEAVLGRPLDKRNFRKKFLSLDLISATNEYFKEGAHRPARLYRFNKQKLESLERSFD